MGEIEAGGGRIGARAGRRRAFVALGPALALGLGLLGGCDHVAQKKLVPGQHTEHDVRALMGVPTLVWDRPDGSREWDYVRAPQGIETLRVEIGPDGRYRGMTQLLTEENFRRARSGMSGDELTRMFSKPTQVERFPRKGEEVWSWRYEGDGRVKYRFNAHIDPATGRATGYSRTDDPQERPGA